MANVRCKFKCVELTQRHNHSTDLPVVHIVKFNPVTSGSEENKEFYQYTPGGSLELAVIKPSIFEIGKEYYLDISEA
jgi:hypothetical protein